MFKTDYQLERLIDQIARDPKKERSLPTLTKQALSEYKELKRQAALPADTRPLRRALMSVAEKASFIEQNGAESYLALPY